MRLSDLDIAGNRPKVLLLQTPSTNLSIFLEDKMKLKYHISSEAIVNVETKKDYKNIRNNLGITPPFSDRWFVKINLDKMHDKDLYAIMQESNTTFFFCTCTRYKLFKECLSKFDKTEIANFYINYLRRPDFVYLYDALTHEDNKLPKNLFSFVVQNYSGDVDSVIELFLKMNQGEVFNNRKQITELCGVGGNSIESFIFSMLKPISGSDKGLKIVIKNRISLGVDLGNTLGYTKFYNFMSASIKRMCEIKELMIAGVVYKHIRNLPDNYDEASLARYQKYIYRLKMIPLSSLLLLRSAMGYKVWRSEADLLEFIYRLYTIYAMEKAKELNGTTPF